MRYLRNLLAAASAVVVLAAFTAAPASADNAWHVHHPRREQVNNRLAWLN